MNLSFQSKDRTEVKHLGDRALTSISILNCLSLHCSPPPAVTLKSPRKITAEIADVVVLHCDVRSLLPATIYWTYQNKAIDGQHLNALSIKVHLTSAGVYSCYATSATGTGRAAESTTLSVASAPVFIEEPKSVTYILPNNGGKKLELHCRASGLYGVLFYVYIINHYLKSLDEQ